MLKGTWGPGGQPAEHKSAVGCCSNEGKLDPALHLQGILLVELGDSFNSTLFRPYMDYCV